MRFFASLIGATLACAAPVQAQTAPSAPKPHAKAATLLIRDATIVDGSGAARRRGDVRLRGDRIEAVGHLRPRRGEAVVAANGLVLAPGFIDTHSHHGSGLDADPGALTAVMQGITTIVIGQDGFSNSPLADYFAKRTAQPAAINVASYSGHNSLRQSAMGMAERTASAADRAAMGKLLAADMAAGALGLSTGLEYDPGRHSDAQEVVELAGVAARQGGRYISHMRSEDRDLWPAVDELIAIGRATHMPVQVSHAKLAMVDLWGQADTLIARLDAARKAGIDATLDVYPYTYWQSVLAVLWPDRDFADRGKAEYILTHLVKPEGLHFVALPSDPDLAGKTLAEIAALRGTDPVTTLVDLAVRNRDKSARVVAESMDERDVIRLIQWPYASISSDGALEDRHPRGAGAFPRVLRRYVREMKVLTLESAIRKMTAMPAAQMGIVGRGMIRPGYHADLVLFDPDTIGDRSTILNPRERAVGMVRMWVNGVEVLGPGGATGARPGRVVRRGDR